MDLFNWDLFLDLVRNNQIVPVIGSDLILVEKENTIIPFYSYLTHKIAKNLNINPGTLNFREFVLENKDKCFFDMAIRKGFNEILEEEVLISDHLEKLSRITGFNFFISTTFDRIFESVLGDEMQKLNKKLQVIDYSYPYRKMDNMIAESGETENPMVFKVLGSMKNKTCAITDEEILEYIFSLKNENAKGDLLFDRMEGKNLLFLGCDFPNWLLRFFIRIITKERFIMSQTEKIIADNYVHKDSNLVLFLKHYKTQIINISEEEFKNPISFINELYDKWVLFNEESIPKKYQGIVFLSYSHRDREIVQKVRNELLANGIEVWYDENKLNTGANYDRIIRERISNCDIFIPFISGLSVSDKESYVYNVEWDMAVSRRKVREYDNNLNSFIHPVIIDDIKVTDDRIPLSFRQLTIDKLNIQELTETIKCELNLITHD